MTEDPKKPLGRILLQQRALSPQELDRALAEGNETGVPLASRLIASGRVTEVQALKALSEQSGVPGIDLSQICIRLADLAVLPREIAVRHRLLPVLVRDDRIFVAMAQPTEKKIIDELEFVTGKRVFSYIALSGPLLRLIVAVYEMRERGEAWYVGPACPPDVLQQAGVASAPTPERGIPAAGGGAEDSFPGAADPQDAPAAAFRPAGALTPVVVDDAMRRMAVADEPTDSGFGDDDRDLSIVTTVPLPDAAQRAGKKTVLIVDDEADIRKLLRRVLEERGYRVIEADKGLAALRLIKESAPDVLVLDAMLPEVHGFDIARRVKGAQMYAHIPIIMVSAVYRGWRFAEDLKTSYGVEAYIEKPFKVGDILRAIADALERRTPNDSERISADAERHLQAGIKAYKEGDLAAATGFLQKGTRIDPLAYRLHFHLGLLYGKQGQVYDAIQELETALQINGRHFPALRNLAVLYQKAGFRNKAIEAWERALRVAPDDATRQSIKEHLLGLL